MRTSLTSCLAVLTGSVLLVGACSNDSASPLTGATAGASGTAGAGGSGTAGLSGSGGATSAGTGGGGTQSGPGGESDAGPPPLVCPPPPPASDAYTADATGITFKPSSGLVRLEVCQDDVFRVRYTIADSLPEKTSLSVNKDWPATAFCIEEDSGIVTVTTLRSKAKVELTSGLVTFTDLDDAVILSEAEKSLTPATVEGVSTHRVETVFDSPVDEALFGLGQHQDGVMNRKGTDRRILNVNTEINVPVLVSNRGYGVFWDNYSTSDFYGGESNETQYRYVSEAGDLVDYYFFHGPSIDQVVALYRTATGSAPLFPKWAYGLFQSKDKYGSQTELLNVKNGYRDNDIPLDVIVQDWDYWNPYAWGSHFMDEGRYPDPAGLIDDMHADNVHTMISIWPVYEDPGTEIKAGELDNFDSLDEMGALYPTSGTHHFYDTFDEAARELVFQQINDRLLGAYGWDAIWADNTEPQGYPDPVNVRTADTAVGKGAVFLNAYPLQHSKGVYEHWRSSGPNQKRVYNLTRSAFAGQQRYATTCWSGDIDSNFPTLERQLPAGLNFAIAGIPYWTTDIGGYWGHPGRIDWTTSESNELFTRWFQYGTFSPIFRVHGGGSRELYGNQWTATTRANLLKFDNLRYRLMPYIYSLAWRVTDQGYTIMRHLVFDYPQDENVFDIDDQFLFGPAILVNPVTAAGVTSRQVYLPTGGWYDFWTGSPVSGGTTITAAAPLSQIPLYVKAGSIVPMGPFIQYATESIDPLEIRVYRGASGSFALYEDEGDTYDYENGEYSLIPFTWNEATQELTIGARTGTYDGMPMNRTFNIVWVDTDHGGGVELATPDETLTYDGSAQVVSAN